MQPACMTSCPLSGLPPHRYRLFHCNEAHLYLEFSMAEFDGSSVQLSTRWRGRGVKAAFLGPSSGIFSSMQALRDTDGATRCAQDRASRLELHLCLSWKLLHTNSRPRRPGEKSCHGTLSGQLSLSFPKRRRALLMIRLVHPSCRSPLLTGIDAQRRGLLPSDGT